MCNVSQCRDSDYVHTTSNKAYKVVLLIQSRKEREGEEGSNQPLHITEIYTCIPFSFVILKMYVSQCRDTDSV